MSSNRKHRLASLVALGERLASDSPEQQEVQHRAQVLNPWFTQQNIERSIKAICEAYLTSSELEPWSEKYAQSQGAKRTVGLILAGNIPLVGFHDLLCVYLSGHSAKIKYSSKDTVLMNYVINQLQDIDESAKQSITVVDRLKDYDAVIATGSNNSGRYFEEYFAHVPHIIRKNRNAIAVLTGSESKEDFLRLGEDIFSYFGLGCRNVSKLYVPEGYNFSPLLEALHDEYKEMVLHHKYKNNFDFNHALFMLNKEKFLMNGCLMVKEAKPIPSRIASVNYEYYSSRDLLAQQLSQQLDDIQCIVSDEPLGQLTVMPLGQAQQPTIADYADGVDTMKFLQALYE